MGLILSSLYHCQPDESTFVDEICCAFVFAKKMGKMPSRDLNFDRLSAYYHAHFD